MPPPLDPDKRAAIADAVAAVAEGHDTRSATVLARELDVARSTLMKVAEELGMADAFDRTQTKRASEAKAADNRSRRAALSSALLDDVARLRMKFFAPYMYVAGGKDGIMTEVLDEPPADAVRNYVTSVAVLIDKHVVLEKVDVEQEQHAAVDVWLRSIVGGNDPASTPVDDSPVD